MTKLLCDIRETKFVDGSLLGPIVQIRETHRPSISSVWATMNSDGFIKYHYLLDKYHCDAIELSLSETAIKAIPNKCRYKEIGITSVLDENAEDLLFDFSNIEYIQIANDIKINNLEKLFPKLKFARFDNYKNQKIHYKPNLWPDLQGLWLESYQGDFSEFVGWDLRTIFLTSPKQLSFAALEKFPSLQTLVINLGRRQYDLAPLVTLKNLKNLMIESNKEQPLGFTSTALEKLVISKLPSLEELNNFPNLRYYEIDKLTSAPKLGLQVKGDLDDGNPFDTILGNTFYQD